MFKKPGTMVSSSFTSTWQGHSMYFMITSDLLGRNEDLGCAGDRETGGEGALKE